MMVHCAKYYYDNQVKENEMGGHVACMGCELYSFKVLVVKTTRQKPLGGNRIGLRMRTSGVI